MTNTSSVLASPLLASSSNSPHTTLSASLRRSWCEVDASALRENIAALRSLLSPGARLGPVVKSNAYGHGMLLAARSFVDSGADWLCVDSLHEALELRRAQFALPLFVLGHVPNEQAGLLAELDCRVVAYEQSFVEAVALAARRLGRCIPLHFKIETGTHRQGLEIEAAVRLASFAKSLEGTRVEGISTHFANVEDTTDHSFARAQLAHFDRASEAFRSAGLWPLIRSISNSAATILWPRAHFELVRPGISAYGMWPSRETYLSAVLAGRPDLVLRPALRWLTRIAQLKTVPVGGLVGYGGTYRATHDTRIAILPVGYYDGYDRALSPLAHVLVHGQRAQLRGRICMNMMMVDVTDIPEAQVGDEVLLLGRAGDESVSAEQLAEWAGTINYELTTRIHEALPRVLIDGCSLTGTDLARAAIPTESREDARES